MACAGETQEPDLSSTTLITLFRQLLACVNDEQYHLSSPSDGRSLGGPLIARWYCLRGIPSFNHVFWEDVGSNVAIDGNTQW